MNTYRKAILVVLSLAFLLNPLHLSANTAVTNGWELKQISRAGSTSNYIGIKYTAGGSYQSTVKITPHVGNVAKFVGRTNFLAAVGLAIKGLFGLVDYVMDPENNSVKITKETGLWTDYDKKVVGSIAVAGRYECAKPHGWGGGGGPIVKDFTYAGFAYVKCNNGYGHIWMHKEEKTLTFTQLAAQILKDAQAGKPEAIAAVGQVADAQATPQWLAGQWERYKRPLAKTNDQEKISPTAEALSQAHRTGKRYGGNCTPNDYRKLEKEKHKYCNDSGIRSCDKGFPSITELRRRAYIAQQCAIARTTINTKCFAGGDQHHRTEAQRAWQVYTRCQEKISSHKGK